MQLERAPLAARLAEALTTDIHRNVCGPRLPAEQAIAEQYGVGRSVVREALVLLRKRGLIATRNGYGSVVVQRGTSGPPQSVGRVVILAGIRVHASMLFQGLRENLLRLGFEVRIEYDEKLLHSRSTSRHHDWMRRWPNSMWILSGVSEVCQRDFQGSNLPTIILGAAHPGVALPCVDWDYSAIAFHAVGTLAARGYRRLALVLPPRMAAGDYVTVQNMERQAARKQFSLHRFVHGTGPNFAASLVRFCRQEAVCCFALRAECAISVYLTLLKSGVRVPESAGLLLRSSDPFLDAIDHPVSHYATNPLELANRTAKAAVSLLRGHSRNPASKLLVPPFVEGQTLAPIEARA